MILVGITGTKGSGKGTVARFVAEWAYYRELLAIERNFADKLKWAMARLFFPGIGREEAIAWADEIKNDEDYFIRCGPLRSEDDRPEAMISGRQLLQHGGTEMGRNLFGSQFWVDQLLPYGFLHEGDKPADIGLISDLRFENEAQRIKRLDGLIWEVRRPGYEPDGHSSEDGLDPTLVDSVIQNRGDLNHLCLQVFALCDSALVAPELA